MLVCFLYFFLFEAIFHSKSAFEKKMVHANGKMVEKYQQNKSWQKSLFDARFWFLRWLLGASLN